MKYNSNKPKKTSLEINTSKEGEPIERKIERMIANKEPITESTVQTLYTERGEGVLAGTNIRTDRFEVAIDAVDAKERARSAEKDKKASMKIVKDNEGEGGETTSTQGTSN